MTDTPLAPAERRRRVARARRAVLRHQPGACLHSWRVLGWCGSVVHGVMGNDNVWLSFRERTGLAAWEAAAGKAAERAD